MPDLPRYRRYRSGPTRDAGAGADPLRELRDLRRSASGEPVAGPPGRGTRAPRDRRALLPRRAPRPPRTFAKRLARWFVVWAVAWTALSVLVFLVSAQLHQVSEGDAVLGGGGTPPVSVANVLVIGSDRRPQGTSEGGAQTSGYGLADSIMLLRIGGGANHKLSIARDTIVQIPGRGAGKINSAYAYGGPELLVQTVEQWTGVDVHHVMQIGFSDFPDLIDAMGGITYKGSCVISRINGGYRNGGVTVRIPSGKRVELNGDQALGLARTRKNECNPRENDLTRARRQQKVISAMKRRALSPIGFVRLPLIAWQAPRTLDSDMAGPRLMGTVAAMALPGGESRVLGSPTGYVDDLTKQAAIDRFLGR